MKIRNLTPHEVTILDHDGRMVTLPPEGIVPRREIVRRDGGLMLVAGTDHEAWAPAMVPDATLHVSVEALGPVVGLPDPEPRTALIVSRLVAEAVPHRQDVFAPGELVRDASGRIVGARGLCRVVPATIQYPVADGCGLPEVGEIEAVHGVRYRVAATLPDAGTGLGASIHLMLA